jgi:signal transduction histidine kinase
MFWRVRVQLALWYATALALIVLAVGGAAYVVVRRDLDRDIDNSLASARTALTSNAIMPTPAPPAGRDSREHEDSEREAARAGAVASDVFYVVTAADGTVTSNPRQVDLEGIPFAKLQADAGNAESRTDIAAGDHRYRIETVFAGDSSGSYIHIGHALDARDRQLGTLARVMIAGGLTGIVLSTAGGLWLAGRALVPIKRSLETQRRFVSDASHELRTPLAAIKANNELLLMHPEATIAENLDQVEAVAAEADQMTHLVEDLLTLARADEGRVDIQREPVELAELAAEVVRDLGALANEAHVELRTDLSPALVEADRQRLRQLVGILTDNALKYTPGGGAVTVRCRRSGRRAELSVSDTGPGIMAELQGRIFDRFYRIDESRTRPAGGSGLGLAIAKWIAEVHGGTIGVDSTVGKGSTFTVRLPARD